MQTREKMADAGAELKQTAHDVGQAASNAMHAVRPSVPSPLTHAHAYTSTLLVCDSSWQRGRSELD
jgi:hypothetical protein